MPEVFESSPRRGRPPGEQTPEALIRAELLAHLRLYKKFRELVEDRLNASEILDAEDINTYMELLRKGIAEMSKSVVPVAKSDGRPPESEENAESVLARLLEGSTR